MFVFKYNHENGDNVQNMKLLFLLCDEKGKGVIEFCEFKRLFKIYRILSGKHDAMRMDNIIQTAFDKIDTYRTGFIKKQDFINYYLENPHIFDSRSPRPSPNSNH